MLVSLSLMAGSLKESAEFINGKKLYTETCISCHGIDGGTNPTMKLIVRPRHLNKSILTQAQMVKVITDGEHAWGAHSDIMPAFKFVYSQDQINNIALYISKEFNSQRNERVTKLLSEADTTEIDETEMISNGKDIFKRNCSLCHGTTGNGKSVYVEQSKENKQFIYPYNLTKILLTEEQIFLYAREGGHYWGTYKEDMPSWKKKYDDRALRSVARYIKKKIVKP